jgi:hypothetical protein
MFFLERVDYNDQTKIYDARRQRSQRPRTTTTDQRR